MPQRRRSSLVALTLLLGAVVAEAQLPVALSRRSSQDSSSRTPSLAQVAAELESDLAKRGLLGTIGCIVGLKNCGSTPTPVIDTLTDVNNCGAVGFKCPASFANGVGSVSCSAGNCISSCRSGFGFSVTRGACIDTTSDALNCGAVGTVCSYANGVGQCSGSTCSLASCATGFFVSGSTCLPNSFQTDPLNCGAAGNICTLATAATGMTCSGGQCKATGCSSGFTLIGGSCQQVNTQNDVNNCGQLGLRCPLSFSNGVGSTCTSGQCRPVSCIAGYAFDTAISACRTITNDPDNCGRVGNVCSATNGVAGCIDGQCLAVSCFAPYQLTNGVCVDTRPQPSNRARVKKSKKPAGLCPAGERACPIAGSKSFLKARSTDFHEFRLTNTAAAPSFPSGGFECLDTQYSIESCGGCASMGEGRNCLEISFVNGVGCDAGKCTIFSCQVGFKLSKDGTACIRSTPARKKKGSRHRLGGVHHVSSYSAYRKRDEGADSDIASANSSKIERRSRLGPSRQTH
ncbi:hypothetical protein OIV83_000815 [Microbotryomycetes sp. JL201]|nr:hypothetical protein OIV83_000815 [Microbotryomycetes sp. JL201]